MPHNNAGRNRIKIDLDVRPFIHNDIWIQQLCASRFFWCDCYFVYLYNLAFLWWKWWAGLGDEVFYYYKISLCMRFIWFDWSRHRRPLAEVFNISYRDATENVLTETKTCIFQNIYSNRVKTTSTNLTRCNWIYKQSIFK